MKIQTVILSAGRSRPCKTDMDGFVIHYGAAPSPFGMCHIAQSPFGICHLSFSGKDDNPSPMEEILRDWPEATIRRDQARMRKLVESIVKQPESHMLLIRGTPFQIDVWRALLAIRPVQTTSYGAIAASLGRPKASRAVGTAVGSNRIAWLIPCHRVLRGDGSIGGYRWGVERKQAMLAWEAARI